MGVRMFKKVLGAILFSLPIFAYSIELDSLLKKSLNASTYLEIDSIKKEGSDVNFWLIYNLLNASNFNNQSILSFKVNYLVNCKLNQALGLSVEIYSKPNAVDLIDRIRYASPPLIFLNKSIAPQKASHILCDS